MSSRNLGSAERELQQQVSQMQNFTIPLLWARWYSALGDTREKITYQVYHEGLDGFCSRRPEKRRFAKGCLGPNLKVSY